MKFATSSINDFLKELSEQAEKEIETKLKEVAQVSKDRLEVSDEYYQSRLPARPKCSDCGVESLTGNVHEETCPQMTDTKSE